jgi:hypothetical protein
MASQLSGERPNALERRSAISGLIPPSALDDSEQCRRRYTELLGKLARTEVEGLQVDFTNELAGMRGIVHSHQ